MSTSLFALTSLAHFFTHLFMLVFPTLAVVLAREWNVPVGELLLLGVPATMLYGIMAFPIGLLADRSGGVVLLIAGLLAMGAASILCGMATGPISLAIGLALLGLGAAAYHPAGLGVLSHVERSAWALGVNGSIGNAAVALAPWLTELLAEGLGWRAAFWVFGAPTILAGLVFSFLKGRIEAGVASAPRHRAHPIAAMKRLATPRFAILAVIIALAGIAAEGARALTPALFDARVSSLGHGAATSASYALAIAMNTVGGSLSERFPPVRVYLVLHALSLPALAGLAVASELPLLVLAGLYATFSLGTQPSENTVLATMTPRDLRSTAYGLKFVLNSGIGALGVPLVSWLMGATSLGTAVLVIAGLLCVGVTVGVLWLRESAAGGLESQ